jgi:hypothetical protein
MPSAKLVAQLEVRQQCNGKCNGMEMGMGEKEAREKGKVEESSRPRYLGYSHIRNRCIFLSLTKNK